MAAAGPRCDASGRCCRFREYGHTLFISQLEADHLLEHAPAFAGSADDAGCPYQIDNLCTARESRPLGCRLYFCDPTYQETGARLSERFIRELKSLADEHGLPWRYAPLHVFLNERPVVGDHCGESDAPPAAASGPDGVFTMRPVGMLAILAVVSAAPAADWPQWLGPKRNASSTETVKPWTAAPKVLWKMPVGEGHSVADRRRRPRLPAHQSRERG